MRRLGPEEWSGLAMLVVTVVVVGPVLFGVAETSIPRGWWIVLFAGFIVTLLSAVAIERPAALRYGALTTAVVLSWSVVLAAPHVGLLPVLLVVTAAVSVHVAPLGAGILLVGLNTAVLAYSTGRDGASPEVLVVSGFYLLIQLAAVLSSVAMIREQRMRRELTEAHIDLQAAAVLLSDSARTAERVRISRELHDLIGHQLTILSLELEAARHRPGEQAREHVDRAGRVARDLLADVRSTVGRLRTESPDLAEALRQVARDIPGLDVSVAVDRDVRAGEEETAAFVRAVQEILTNTIKHAGARTLRIEVRAEGSRAVLTAVDDGRGAREPTPGNGLRGIAERFEALGGDVTFDGSEGFRVTARAPVT
ncbi:MULTISPECIES: sensor histidine kinase [unclassified Blastococcus]